ncbi:MAG: hypothetical protein KGQ42_06150, partial [Alphaproteobacteria bacterium]|nr:hypothetical protein [Alphaproteobacteria bacterium]
TGVSCRLLSQESVSDEEEKEDGNQDQEEKPNYDGEIKACIECFVRYGVPLNAILRLLGRA